MTRTALPDAIRYQWDELVAQARNNTTFGTGGVRDPDAPCASFTQGIPAGSCSSDGHYLCHECRYFMEGIDHAG